MTLPTTDQWLRSHGFTGRALDWIDVSERQRRSEYDLECALFYDHDGHDDPHTDPSLPILPGREADRITYDLSDWDGISIEFKDYKGDLPTEDEQARIFALGFSVIDIEHKPDGEKTVIWRQVRGYPHGHCFCHKLDCGCHPQDVVDRVKAAMAERAAKAKAE